MKRKKFINKSFVSVRTCLLKKLGFICIAYSTFPATKNIAITKCYRFLWKYLIVIKKSNCNTTMYRIQSFEKQTVHWNRVHESLKRVIKLGSASLWSLWSHYSHCCLNISQFRNDRALYLTVDKVAYYQSHRFLRLYNENICVDFDCFCIFFAKVRHPACYIGEHWWTNWFGRSWWWIQRRCRFSRSKSVRGFFWPRSWNYVRSIVTSRKEPSILFHVGRKTGR